MQFLRMTLVTPKTTICKEKYFCNQLKKLHESFSQKSSLKTNICKWNDLYNYIMLKKGFECYMYTFISILIRYQPIIAVNMENKNHCPRFFIELKFSFSRFFPQACASLKLYNMYIKFKLLQVLPYGKTSFNVQTHLCVPVHIEVLKLYYCTSTKELVVYKVFLM